MMIRLKISSLKEGRWYEYVIRFALGGLSTLVAGIVADIWGSEIGGLFLAFPAILCASATLVESHERRKKHERRVRGQRRGTDAAALETAGAAVGSVALGVFAVAVWRLAPDLGPSSLAVASGGWLLVATTLWRLRRHIRRTS
jgi:Protein of unknown function (DUF3147)